MWVQRFLLEWQVGRRDSLGVTLMATKSEGQIGLFASETPYVPAWKKSNTEFDSSRGQHLKRQGMSAAASARQELLAVVKAALIRIAQCRESRCVTADDAQNWLLANGYSEGALGNAMGCLFRRSEWVLVKYRPSERAARHLGMVGVWQLKQAEDQRS